jgi:hypothetical protein
MIEGVSRNAYGIHNIPTASPGHARERMYFIQTKSSRAIEVTVLDREREREGERDRGREGVRDRGRERGRERKRETKIWVM